MRHLPRSRPWRFGCLEHGVMPFQALHVGGVLSYHPLEQLEELGRVLRLRAKRIQECTGGRRPKLFQVSLVSEPLGASQPKLMVAQIFPGVDSSITVSITR